LNSFFLFLKQYNEFDFVYLGIGCAFERNGGGKKGLKDYCVSTTGVCFGRYPRYDWYLKSSNGGSTGFLIDRATGLPPTWSLNATGGVIAGDKAFKQRFALFRFKSSSSLQFRHIKSGKCIRFDNCNVGVSLVECPSTDFYIQTTCWKGSAKCDDYNSLTSKKCKAQII
jgi:hypothetical protein